MVAVGLQGRTPLHHAAYANDAETIKVMLRYGADAKALDSQVHPCQVVYRCIHVRGLGLLVVQFLGSACNDSNHMSILTRLLGELQAPQLLVYQ